MTTDKGGTQTPERVDEWQMGLFDVLAGDPGDSTVCTTAGYYCDLFGIDQRWAEFNDGTLHPCWTITHLPSGYNICAHLGEEDEARAFVETIKGVGNWDFVSPDGAKPLSAAMGAIFRENDQVVNPRQLLPALWLRKKHRKAAP